MKGIGSEEEQHEIHMDTLLVELLAGSWWLHVYWCNHTSVYTTDQGWEKSNSQQPNAGKTDDFQYKIMNYYQVAGEFEYLVII